MADYAIGLSFHKAHRTLVRAVELSPPARYFATRSDAGLITLPTLASGTQYIEMQGLRNVSFSVNDNNQEFRLLGDDGWSDSVITGSSVQANVTSYFMKDSERKTSSTTPVFCGDYDEGFKLIEKSRYNKDYEIYIEFLKEIGQANGSSGNWIYDFTGFNAVISNYSDNLTAEGLTEISFNLMSRGAPVIGKYDAGSSKIAFGGVFSTLLFLVEDTRELVFDPANNSLNHPKGDSITVKYTSDGTSALTQLKLSSTATEGYSLEEAASNKKVTAVVTLSGHTVTVNPAGNLKANTIYRLNIANGAMLQKVGSDGSASATGTYRPIQGATTFFRTGA